MRKYLVLLSLCLSTCLYGQTLLQYNSEWSQEYHSIAWGIGGSVIWDFKNYYTIKLTGDTLIDDSSFQKLIINNEFAGIVNQDVNRVFFGNHPDSLRLLFDFGLKPGDTFRLHAPDWSSWPDDLVRTIVSVDSIMTGGSWRKRIIFDNIPGYEKGPVWVEGIGDVNFGGIELDYSYAVWFGNTKKLLCFSVDDHNLYGDCVMGVSEINHKIKVYPNPSGSYFILNLSELTKPVEIVVTTIDGKIIYNTYTFLDQYTFEPGRAGVYILKISDRNRNSAVKLVAY